MQYEVEVNGRRRQVSVRRAEGQFIVTLDGRDWTVDAARVDPHTWSLLIQGTVEQTDAVSAPELKLGPTQLGLTKRSYEVTLAADAASGGLTARVDDTPIAVVINGRRRWGKKDDSAATGSSGPERLVAPMPGKIVRVLVKTGEAVRARQPVVVIEAMKMENELRASADGLVAEMHVRDGQSVDAGTLLAVIHR